MYKKEARKRLMCIVSLNSAEQAFAARIRSLEDSVKVASDRASRYADTIGQLEACIKGLETGWICPCCGRPLQGKQGKRVCAFCEYEREVE
jgi:rubrerythrin